MEPPSETSSRCGTLPGSKNDSRHRVNANSRPRCILPLHSNCWAEISTLAGSELAQKERFPDRGTTSQHHPALSWFAAGQGEREGSHSMGGVLAGMGRSASKRK